MKGPVTLALKIGVNLALCAVLLECFGHGAWFRQLLPCLTNQSPRPVLGLASSHHRALSVQTPRDRERWKASGRPRKGEGPTDAFETGSTEKPPKRGLRAQQNTTTARGRRSGEGWRPHRTGQNTTQCDIHSQLSTSKTGQILGLHFDASAICSSHSGQVPSRGPRQRTADHP